MLSQHVTLQYYTLLSLLSQHVTLQTALAPLYQQVFIWIQAKPDNQCDVYILEKVNHLLCQCHHNPLKFLSPPLRSFVLGRQSRETSLYDCAMGGPEIDCCYRFCSCTTFINFLRTSGWLQSAIIGVQYEQYYHRWSWSNMCCVVFVNCSMCIHEVQCSLCFVLCSVVKSVSSAV